MKKGCVLSGIFVWVLALSLIPCVALARSTPSRSSLSPSPEQEWNEKVSAVRIPFVQNVGQISQNRVLFQAAMLDGSLFVEKDGITYGIPHPTISGRTFPIRERFLRAQPASPEGRNPAKTRVNYFKGRNPQEWRRNLAAYNEVHFPRVYDDIELNLKISGNNVEKVFVVHKGGKPDDIFIGVEGVNNLSINSDGELELISQMGRVKLTKPIAFQTINGKQVPVTVSYNLTGSKSYGFKVGHYNEQYPLVIDPLLAYTFVGGSKTDWANAFTVSGNSVYVAGYTNSTDYPITDNAFSANNEGSKDAFISKLSKDLTTLELSTFIGGTGDDVITALTFDGDGNLLVVGYTKSVDFPITDDAFQDYFSGANSYDEAFVCKLSIPASDDEFQDLIASTYLGGTAGDQAYNVFAYDDGTSETIYISGVTGSLDFPTNTRVGYSIYPHGGNEGFIIRLKKTLQFGKPLVTTFLGGNKDDVITSMKDYVDSSTGDLSIYVAGTTNSKDFPTTPGAYGRIYKGDSSDGFISYFDATLEVLGGSTYLGGKSNDTIAGIDVDGEGVFVGGSTKSSNFPLRKGYYRIYKGYEDGFVARLGLNLKTLDASTFLGGSSSDFVTKVVKTTDNVLISGYTKSTDFLLYKKASEIAVNVPYSTVNKGSEDVFVWILNEDLKTRVASTLLGGASSDYSCGVYLDGTSVFVAGTTKSNNIFPLDGTGTGYDITYNAAEDVFIATFDDKLLTD